MIDSDGKIADEATYSISGDIMKIDNGQKIQEMKIDRTEEMLELSSEEYTLLLKK